MGDNTSKRKDEALVLDNVNNSDNNNVNSNDNDGDNEKKSKSINSLFMSLTDEDETFSTYLVYIMRKNDSIEKVLETYDVTREELASYNDLDALEVGSKLIIPCKNE